MGAGRLSVTVILLSQDVDWSAKGVLLVWRELGSYTVGLPVSDNDQQEMMLSRHDIPPKTRRMNVDRTSYWMGGWVSPALF